MGLLFLLVSAHLIADFILQTDKIALARNSKFFKKMIFSNLEHAAIHLIFYFVFIAYYWSWYSIVAIIILAGIHFFVDLFKSYGSQKCTFIKSSVCYFIIDQVVHLACITICASLIFNHVGANQYIKCFIEYIVLCKNKCLGNLSYNDKLSLTLSLMILGTGGTGILNKKIIANLNKHSSKVYNFEKNNNGAHNGGFIIGILERILIIIVVIMGYYSIIGFALTTKSIARFKKFDDDSFVEIFIIGSFVSFISAIIIGLIIKQLNIIQ